MQGDNKPFRIFSASAGSGKTYNLVKELIKLFYNPRYSVPVERVLAVTFTNKAANEMKSRLLEKLHYYAKGGTDEISGELTEKFNLSQQQWKERSRRLADEILFHYDKLSFSTIDKFTYRIIRRFARELNVALSANVEMNVKERIDEIIDDSIEKIDRKHPLFSYLKKLVLEKLAEGRHWDIGRDLKQNIPYFIISDPYYPVVRELQKIDAKELRNLRGELVKQIAIEGKIIVEAAEVLLRKIQTYQKEISNFNNLKKALVHLTNKQFDKIFDNKSFSRLLSGNLTKKGKSIPEDELLAIRRSAEKLQSHIYARKQKSIVLSGLNPLGIYSVISKAVEEFKNEHDLIFISDFNKIVSEVVEESSAPFIYWRLGEKLNHFFIDEFQDTSVIQWRNMIPLIAEAFARHPAYPQAGLALFGDPKQSIYRFRGGDPEQFIALTQKTNPFGQHIGKRIIPLTDNWRSGRKIVDFNNRFFPFLAGKYELPDSYRQVYSPENVSQTPKKDFDGYVELDMDRSEDETAFLEKLSGKIDILLKEKGFEPQDICILTDTNDQVDNVAAFLIGKGHKVLSENHLKLNNSIKLQLLHLLFRYRLQQDDTLLSEIFRLFSAIRNERLDAREIEAAKRNSFEDLIRRLGGEVPSEINTLNLSGFFSALIRTLALDDDSEKAYLRTFLSQINKLPESDAEPVRYLAYWENELGVQSISMPANVRAIRVMTVHKAKGLQFPVVFYAYASGALNPKLRDLIWVESPAEWRKRVPFIPVTAANLKKWAIFDEEKKKVLDAETIKMRFDALNRMYVAFTRPEEQFYWMPFYKKNKPALLQEIIDHFERDPSFDSGRMLWRSDGEIPSHRSTGTKEETDFESYDPAAIHISPENDNRLKINVKNWELWSETRRAPVRFGVLVHHYLGKIKYRDDLEQIRREIIREHGEEEAKIITGLIEKVVSHPGLKKFFSPPGRVLNERSIAHGKQIHRPDRIVMQPDGKTLSLIDYKTGEPLPGHRVQITTYGQLLQEAGYDVTEKLLVYIRETGSGDAQIHIQKVN